MNQLLRLTEWIAIAMALANLITGNTEQALTWTALALGITANRRLDDDRRREVEQ